MAERKHSEVRQRTRMVGLRLSPAESGLLKAEAARRGWSEARVLRETFLASLAPQPAIYLEHGESKYLSPERQGVEDA